MRAAVILAGGRARRLGGVDKPRIEVAGRPLIEYAVAAATECDPVILVGSDAIATDDRIRTIWENPRFGGPAAGLLAGLAALETLPDQTEVLVLAADLPEAVALVRRLDAVATPSDADGVVAVDEDGQQQWLAGRYRLGALRAAGRGMPESNGASMKRLLGALVLRSVDVDGAAIDLDTWDAIDHYRRTPTGRNTV